MSVLYQVDVFQPHFLNNQRHESDLWQNQLKLGPTLLGLPVVIILHIYLKLCVYRPKVVATLNTVD